MTDQEKQLAWIGGLFGAGLILWWLYNNLNTYGVSPSGQSVTLPASVTSAPVSYSPADFTIGAPSVAQTANNPGSSAIFNIGGNVSNLFAGTTSPDACTGGCNCPSGSSSVIAFGSPSDAAAAAAPLFQWLADQLPPVDTVSQYDVAMYGGKNLIQTDLRAFQAHNQAIEQAAEQLTSSGYSGV